MWKIIKIAVKFNSRMMKKKNLLSTLKMEKGEQLLRRKILLIHQKGISEILRDNVLTLRIILTLITILIFKI